MEQYYPILATMPLFHGITGEGFTHVLRCLEAFVVTAEKGQVLYRNQEQVEYGMIVLDGSLHALLLNSNGGEHRICEFGVGQLIGGAYACVPEQEIPVQTQAIKDSTLLYVKLSNLLKDTSIGCPYASRVTVNLLRHVAMANVFQVRKIHILTQKKIRDKLLMYLESIGARKQSVLLPFNRQELADYLGVERSALSREMSYMQEEGVLEYHKNTLRLLG